MNVSREDFAVIESLDLEPIKAKLMHKHAGKGWSKERVEAAESEYRRFLYLAKTYPNELAAPSVEVDKFWHQHILDTVKYAHDCQAIFGYFLHHDPYLGLSGERGDEAVRQRAGQRMRELYEVTFGEAAPGAEVAWGTSAAWCTVTKPAASVQSAETAWCTRAQAAGTAWCTVSRPDRADAPEPGRCTAKPAARPHAAEPAWCTLGRAVQAATAH